MTAKRLEAKRRKRAELLGRLIHAGRSERADRQELKQLGYVIAPTVDGSFTLIESKHFTPADALQ